MNGKCIDERGNLKRCPFMVNIQERKNVYGAYTEQMFRKCIGDSCAAYHDGYCLRLTTPPITEMKIDNKNGQKTPKITIQCTEEEKQYIINILAGTSKCVFLNDGDKCDGHNSCIGCIRNGIEWVIVDG